MAGLLRASRFRLLIMTLATLALVSRTWRKGISQARSVRGYPEWFFQLGQGDVLGVPTQLWILCIAIVIGVAVAIVLLFSVGSLYAIGHNETGARFSGIPGRSIQTLSSIPHRDSWQSLAGCIFVSRVSTTRSDMGTGLELDVIAAVVLGGTSIFGGVGTIVGNSPGVHHDPAPQRTACRSLA